MKSGSIIALPGESESFSLEVSDGQTVYIGRKVKACGSNESDRVILPYPEVSARHAEIRCQEGKWTIIDAGSTNGTSVNGVRLNPGKEYALRDNDTIGIANYTLVISAPQQSSIGEAEKWLAEGTQTEQDKTHLQVKLIHATILVADLKNYTSLMEEHAHDPSIVMQAAGRVFATLNSEIEKNGGQLEKIAGDAIMAYWPNKSTQGEVDTSGYRACLTALNMQEITKKLAANKKIWPFPQHPLCFDIALASGPVAKGALGKSQGNPALLGDTANLVFRMEKLINDDKHGQIIVEQNTYDLAKENFEFILLGDRTIKGRLNFVTIYQLLTVRD